MPDEILTIAEVAEYLKVTEKTVYGLAQKRQIPGFKVGGQWRFRRTDIATWIGSLTGDAMPSVPRTASSRGKEENSARADRRKRP
jgi:excisionase family DNA binding protein